MPKLSVVMGVYNAEPTVLSSIDSILSQSFVDFEFIICDDGSSDKTLEILEDLAKTDGRIMLVKNDCNQGLAYSLNRCIDAAHSEFIVRQDADDISLPLRLQKLYDFMTTNYEVAVAGSFVSLSDDSGVWGQIAWPKKPENSQWMMRPQIVHASCIMRKKNIISVGGYDVKAIRVEDIDLWFRLLAVGDVIVNIPDFLYQVSWSKSDYRRRKAKYRLSEALCKFRGCRDLQLPFWYYLYAFKPLLLMFIPHRWMSLFHNHIFRKR